MNSSTVDQSSANGTGEGVPLEQDSVPAKDKESDPATTTETLQENTDAAKEDLPVLEPKKSRTL